MLSKARDRNRGLFLFCSMKNLWFLLITLLILACDRSGRKDPPVRAGIPKARPDPTLAGTFAEAGNLRFDSTAITEFTTKYPRFKSLETALRTFYAPRRFGYAWYDRKGLTEQAANLYNHVVDPAMDGLSAATPYRKEFDTLFETAMAHANRDPVTDIMFTAQYLQYGQKVFAGLSEKEIREMGWYIPRKKISLTTLLDSMVSNPGYLASGKVLYRQYGLLRNVLQEYRQIADKGGWPLVPVSTKNLSLGDSASEVRVLRRRLFLTHDLASDDESPTLDSTVFNALKIFQQRSGLRATGKADEATLRELNVPVEKRLQQIVVNMERCRWLPNDADTGDYIGINIPEYKLHVYRGDSLLWSMDVVVGTVLNKTVIFTGEVQYVVFSPYWHVPVSIVRKEVVPGMKRNGNYLASHNMEITGYANGLPLVRQKPGRNNSLGLVKFLFPNSYSIYMHDSPAKSLFTETSRAFSHGCIRLAEPGKMAQYLLRNDPQWTGERIAEAMNRGKEQYVTLKNKVPVYIVYFTAWVARDGRINFRKDIYERDERLANTMYSGGELVSK